MHEVRRRAVRPRLEFVERRLVLSSFTVETTADDGPGSLRWAISQANADPDPGPSKILFDIPGDGLRTIRLQTPLDPIGRPVLIEGRSQPGYAGVPIVQLAGPDSRTDDWYGLILSGGRSVVAGLAFTGFSRAGVLLTGPGGNFVESCYVGLVPGQAGIGPNGDGIVILGSSGNTIGGQGGQGNVISGNRGAGVRVQVMRDGDSANNAVVGNRIGTDSSGMLGLGNGQDGVVFAGATAGRIADNLISANRGNGVYLNARSSGNVVIGNVVGLTAAGLSSLGNLLDGVLVDDSPFNRIGGTTPSEANQISGNLGSGVRARFDSAGLSIQGNLIGTDVTTTLALGNQADGVTLASSGVEVGGTASGAGNVIAYNGAGSTGAGVQLVGQVRGNSILTNRIFANRGLGINLRNGPTSNHTPGEFAGPNDWINYPTLTTSSTDGIATRASGTYQGLPNKTYTIQLFWSRQPDKSGFGEAERVLGQVQATTDDRGLASFAVPALAPSNGGFVTATATDSDGNTSEFARSVLIQPYTDLNVVVSASPPVAVQGTAVTYTVTVTNNGHLDANSVSLTAQVPSWVTGISASADRGVLARQSGDGVQLFVGGLGPGQSATLTLVVTPPDVFTGNLVVSASGRMVEPDYRPGDESASATARLTPLVDVALKLADGPTAATRGDRLSYVLTASNAGPGAASNVVMTLPIGAGMSYLGATAGQGSVTYAAGVLTVDFGTIGPNSSVDLDLTLLADAAGAFGATASLSSDAYDADSTNQTATLATLVRANNDLSLVMKAPAVAAQDGDVVYDVVVTNGGADFARNVQVLDLIPTGADFVSAQFEGGEAGFANRIVTARLAELRPGASATLRIVVRPTATAGFTLVNAARVTADDEDPNRLNNADWRTTVLRPSGNLGVTIRPASPTVLQGGPAKFLIRVSNLGTNPEPDARLSIPLPPGSTLVSSRTTSGSLSPTVASDVASIALGALDPGGWVDVEVMLQPGAGFTGTLPLGVHVQGFNVDSAEADDRATASVTVLPAADLATYVGPPSSVFERTTFRYTLTAANLSTSTTTGVRLTADLPAGVEFVSAVSSQGDAPFLQSGRVIARMGSLAANATATMTITVRPTSPAGALLLLSGTTTSDVADGSPGNDTGRYAVKVVPAVDLMVRLRPLQASVELGGDVTWVAEVWNSSATTASDVAVTVPFGSFGTFVGSATTQGTVRTGADSLTASIGTLAPGKYATVAFVLRPRSLGVASLTASASSRLFDTKPENDRSTASITVLEPTGTVRFGTSSIVVPETVGPIVIPVERVGGARGVLSVRYRTTGGDATAGVDYQPVSGTLTFQPGQTLALITLPILPCPHNRGDKTVGIVLEADPADRAALGAANYASVTIQDVDPDFTPPTVSSVRLLGDPNSIAGLAIGLSEPVRFDSATFGGAYSLYDLGPDGMYGDGDDVPLAYSAPGYDPASRTVYLTPASPMALGRHYAVVVRGAGSAGIVDLAGNPLGGGVDYVGLFARGTSLQYTDSTGDSVSLQVKDGGFLDLLRTPSGEARLLALQGVVAGRTSLSGAVTRPRGRGDGVTTIETVTGLGSFGDVRVSLKSPPFLARDIPFTPARGGRPVPTAPPTPPRAPALLRRPGPTR